MRLVARFAILALLGTALWNPSLPWGRAPLDVIALVDDSLSVERSAVDQAWQRVTTALHSLPKGGRLHLLRFASDTALEVEGIPLEEVFASGLLGPPELPRRELLSRTATDLERSLEAALRLVQPARPAALVLISDGVETRGNAARSFADLRASGVPVVAIPVSMRGAEGDVWIEGLWAPQSARVDESIRVVALLGAFGRRAASFRLGADGLEVARVRVDLRPGVVHWIEVTVPVRDAGPCRLEASVEAAGDPRPENNVKQAIVDVEGRASVLYLTTQSEPQPLAHSLELGGWEIVLLRPAELRRASISFPELVVLDDVAIAEASDADWRALDALVRYQGTGLLVLGGPHAFAAGGYRGSVLESLLPVTAEASEPRSRTALLFLVDTSGSMERDRAGRPRLELARQAVVESMRTLSEGDFVGVSTFALEPREALPLGSHRTEGAPNLASLPAASGGTRLLPALRHGLERLGAAPADQRLLVLVTDGFVPEERIGSLGPAIAEAGIEVIALAVGADVELRTLKRLAETTGGALRRVDDVVELPRLMRREVGERLEPAVLGRVHPRGAAPLPYPFVAETWPELAGYMVSRARPGAVVSLESERGDPLFASHEAGVGRVVALPGGLGGWAAAWTQWTGWGSFVGGLAQWLSRPSGTPHLHARLEETPEGFRVEVDALSTDSTWSTEPSAVLTAIGPRGDTRTLTLPALAPGRFSGTLPAPIPGPYRLAVRVGDRVRALLALRTANREHALAPAASKLGKWAEAGLLEVWPEGGRPTTLRPPRRWARPRALVTLLALTCYLALVIREATRPTTDRHTRDLSSGGSSG